mmetsp:Transcript_62125/g.171845  ORF Transcript_62125/g.171845 Transcript_62125/m.171845 type:complete len:551 (-) Transcript_62125:4169-5821(-)
MLLGRDVAEHGRAHPADHGRADGRGDVVVARRDVDGEGPQRVERRLVAGLELLVHIGLNHVQGHMAGAFDHGLHIVLPCDLCQLAQGAQLGELGLVVGIGQAAGAQAVTQREGDVVGLHDLADLFEVRVQEVLAVVGDAPFGQDGAAARHDAGAALGGHRDEGQAQAGVDGEVVHPLLGLLDQRVAEHRPVQVLGHAAHLLQRLVDRHGADGHGRVADDPVPRGVDVAAGGEVHHRVGTPAGGPDQLLHLLLDAGSDGGVADVGVDLDAEVAADDGRLQLGVVDIGRDDRAAAGHLVAHELGRDDLGHARAHRIGGEAQFALGVGEVIAQPVAAAVLAQRDELHLRRDDAAARIVQLADIRTGHRAARCALQRGSLGAQCGDALVVFLAAIVLGHARPAGVGLGVAAVGHPGAAHLGQALAWVEGGARVGVRPGGVGHDDGLAVAERDLAHRHAHIGPAARDVDLARGGEGFAGQRQTAVDGLGQGMGVSGIHGGLLGGWSAPGPPAVVRRRPVRMHSGCAACRHGMRSPYAGTNRFKFTGLVSSTISAP